MLRLWLKRILIAAVLAGALLGLAEYNLATAASGYDSIVRLANNRKQKTDYDRLFDEDLFKSITIVFTETEFTALLDDMKAYFEKYGTYQDNTMHKVDMIYADGEGNTFTVREVGFRTKSNTSRNLPMTLDWRGREIWHQTSFQLQFDATFDYGARSNEYAVLSSREVFNLDQLNFEYCKTVAGEVDEAMISESYAYKLYRRAGLDVANASYGLVYLQVGEETIPYGFFTFIEPIDQNFLKRHFDADIAREYGDLYKCTDTAGVADLGLDFAAKAGVNDIPANIRFSYALKNNTNDGMRSTHPALASLVAVVNGDDFERDIASVLDVDAFVRYLAMGFLIGNTDDFRFNFNNYYLYFDVYDGPATMIPFDLDSSLGVGKHQDPTGNHGVDYDLFPASDANNGLVDRVLSIPVYRDLYLDYLEEYAILYFGYENYAAEYAVAKALYEDVLIAEDHLGNQLFDPRNSEWYFTVKATTVTSALAALRG
ncbi:MAG: CotH kinase family protein [Candidatus Izemoplasmatales bacterium]